MLLMPAGTYKGFQVLLALGPEEQLTRRLTSIQCPAPALGLTAKTQHQYEDIEDQESEPRVTGNAGK